MSAQDKIGVAHTHTPSKFMNLISLMSVFTLRWLVNQIPPQRVRYFVWWPFQWVYDELLERGQNNFMSQVHHEKPTHTEKKKK